MKNKHIKTLRSLFAHPISGNIKWSDIEALLLSLGAEIEERAGSRVAVFLFDEVYVFHRPHPTPNTDKGAVAAVRDWLKRNGVTV
ncbi:MAG: type II toxin-antitoxin system HicA family toxin [Neisseriaceae bacterium]|nr:type II toxin-antitoxin system HicA family toxin [Neisseriaceae bacterium]MBO7554697.1 type II toxin-antitoxin system HicA family toxin [Neisseriaceae bacterium]